jgi:hypothetical protein
MTDQELKDLVASLAESQKETDQEMRKTDRALKDLVASLAESRKETDLALKASLAESQKETDQEMRKTDRALKDLVASLAESQKETDLALKASLAESRKETDQEIRMTDRALKDMVASLAESRKETDLALKASLAESDQAFKASLAESRKESEREMRELRIHLGGLADKFGSYTEGLALPSMTKILYERFHMEVVMPQLSAHRNGRSFEVDVLATSNSGRDEVYVVEVKSHLRHEAIDQMKKTLREIHDFIPGHRGKKLYGILAAVDAPARVREKVLREGIYLARIHDGEFELQVPADFQPRAF